MGLDFASGSGYDDSMSSHRPDSLLYHVIYTQPWHNEFYLCHTIKKYVVFMEKIRTHTVKELAICKQNAYVLMHFKPCFRCSQPFASIPGSIKLGKGCNQARYSTVECQKHHWKWAHKQIYKAYGLEITKDTNNYVRSNI